MRGVCGRARGTVTAPMFLVHIPLSSCVVVCCLFSFEASVVFLCLKRVCGAGGAGGQGHGHGTAFVC